MSYDHETNLSVIQLGVESFSVTGSNCEGNHALLTLCIYKNHCPSPMECRRQSQCLLHVFMQNHLQFFILDILVAYHFEAHLTGYYAKWENKKSASLQKHKNISLK